MDHILKALASRKELKNPFGYGLGTAVNHVKRFMQSASNDELAKFGVSNERAGVAAIKRAQQTLTHCSEDMVQSKLFTSSHDFKDILPSGVELHEKTLLVMEHVLTTDRVDRDNDILRTSGAKLDPKAPMLWQHMNDMPIGGVLFQVSHTDHELKVASALLDLNEITHDAGILIEANMLRFSHGFRVIDFEEREKSEDTFGFPGFDIKEFEIMEASLVSVPSNIDAEIEVIAGKAFESTFFKSYQKELVDNRPVQVPGTSLDDSQLSLKFGGAEITIKGNTVENPVDAAIDTEPEPKKDVLAELEGEAEQDEPVESNEVTKESVVGFLIQNQDEATLKMIRDVAAGQIELIERKQVAEQFKKMVG